MRWVKHISVEVIKMQRKGNFNTNIEIVYFLRQTMLYRMKFGEGL